MSVVRVLVRGVRGVRGVEGVSVVRVPSREVVQPVRSSGKP